MSEADAWIVTEAGAVNVAPLIGLVIETAGGELDGAPAVMRTILPFYSALTAALLAVTYIPEFSLWLPRLAGYLQ